MTAKKDSPFAERKGVVYPRFLGVDNSGDFVWEVVTGRWTWGDDPFQAATRERTWTPEDYLDKYGPVEPVALATEQPDPAAVDRGGVLGPKGRKGAHRALKRTLDVLDDWVRGAKDNHEALEHRGRESTGYECWRSFAPSDIRAMINDAARELGLTEFPLPEQPEEDR